MKTVLMGVLVFASLSFGDYKAGDVVADMCWKDAKDVSYCLKDTDGKVRVLLYNAGWCAPCRREMRELVERKKLKADVVYLSLSCGPIIATNPVNASFLRYWDNQYGFTKAGIKVLASPKDCGRYFGGDSIPSVAVIEADRTLRAFKTSPGVDWIEAQ